MKIKYYCLLFLCLFLIIERVYAVDGSVRLDCDNVSLKPGASSNCIISGKNFNDSISSFHAKISLGEKLVLVSSKIDESWHGSADDGIIDLYTDVNKSGNINFASFKIKAMDNVSSNIDTKVFLEEIFIGDSSFKETKIDTQIVDIKISIENNGSNNNDNNNQDQNDKEDNTEEDGSDLENGNNNNNNDNSSSDSDNNNIIEQNPSTGGNIFFVGILMISCILFSLFYMKKVLEVK